MSMNTYIWLGLIVSVVGSVVGGYISYRTIKKVRKLEKEYL